MAIAYSWRDRAQEKKNSFNEVQYEKQICMQNPKVIICSNANFDMRHTPVW